MIKPQQKSSATGKGAATNKKTGSLVKTIVLEDIGKWVKPKSGEKFFIDEDAIFPSITFEIETADPPPYEWTWSLSWPANVSGLRESSKRGKVLKTFTKTAAITSSNKSWLADLAQVVGGALTVKVKTARETFKRSIYILGKNPGETRVATFLISLQDVKGFDKLLAQESKYKNFINSDGYPVVAFDGGYGMTQMTNPAPNFEQAWNWKENIKGGATLYKSKQAIAKKYLSKQQRNYTEEQLKLETWSLWNGGNYHVWSETTKTWIRNPNILDDTATGNIGWDMTKEENKGKTEIELHERDKDQYKSPQQGPIDFGCTQEYVMQTTSTVNKIIRILIFAFSITSHIFTAAAHAESSLAFQFEKQKILCIGEGKRKIHQKCDELVDIGSLDVHTRQLLRRSDEILSVFSQPTNAGHYLVLIARIPSKTPQSIGYCGAGLEDHLLLLKYTGKKLKLQDDFLLQSCLKSIALDTDSGEDILKAISIDTEKYAIGFRWLTAPDDKDHTITISAGKFSLN